MTDDGEKISQWIRQARNMVFLGGAGVSTASGIPDFRSAKGIRPDFETILSHNYFMLHPKEFYDFYRAYMVHEQAQPNSVHKALARWEQQGHLQTVITQNIDGLHQAAGSAHVLELHGSIWRNHCQGCGKFYSLVDVMTATAIPRCECGGIIKPDVVLYGEMLDPSVWKAAVEAVGRADLVMVAGTSLKVYPAAGLVEYGRHARVVLINREPTAMDCHCDAAIHGELEEIFARLTV